MLFKVVTVEEAFVSPVPKNDLKKYKKSKNFFWLMINSRGSAAGDHVYPKSNPVQFYTWYYFSFLEFCILKIDSYSVKIFKSFP